MLPGSVVGLLDRPPHPVRRLQVLPDPHLARRVVERLRPLHRRRRPGRMSISIVSCCFPNVEHQYLAKARCVDRPDAFRSLDQATPAGFLANRHGGKHRANAKVSFSNRLLRSADDAEATTNLTNQAKLQECDNAPGTSVIFELTQRGARLRVANPRRGASCQFPRTRTRSGDEALVNLLLQDQATVENSFGPAG